MADIKVTIITQYIPPPPSILQLKEVIIWTVNDRMGWTRHTQVNFGASNLKTHIRKIKPEMGENLKLGFTKKIF
jgi:hypothetical protein